MIFRSMRCKLIRAAVFLCCLMIMTGYAFADEAEGAGEHPAGAEAVFTEEQADPATAQPETPVAMPNEADGAEQAVPEGEALASETAEPGEQETSAQQEAPAVEPDEQAVPEGAAAASEAAEPDEQAVPEGAAAESEAAEPAEAEAAVQPEAPTADTDEPDEQAVPEAPGTEEAAVLQEPEKETAAGSEGNKVERLPRAEAKAASAVSTASTASAPVKAKTSPPITKGWHTENGHRMYYNGSKFYTDSTQKIGSKFYHFDENGYLVYGVYRNGSNYYYSNTKSGVMKETPGWITWNKTRYRAARGGRLISNKAFKVGKKKYHAGIGGKILTGVHKWSSKYFYANAKGVVRAKKGFFTWKGKRYYSRSSGSLYKSRFITVQKKKYYASPTAAIAIGPYTVGSKMYYTDKNGAVTKTVAVSKPVPKKTFLQGIDVSYWQYTIDWKKVKQAGIDFAIIRCGYRTEGSGELNEDSYFMSNMKNAKAAGIPVGVYIYSQALNASEGKAEANYAIKLIEKSGCKDNLKYSVVIDSEGSYSSRLVRKTTVKKRTAGVKAFCEQVIKKGYTPMIYASTSWLENRLDMSKLKDYTVWVAQYYTKVTYEGAYRCWQYTSRGHVNGIKGYVDMNRWYL